MAFRQRRSRRELPLQQAIVSSVERAPLKLIFNDTPSHFLELCGEWHLVYAGEAQQFVWPYADWVYDTLDSLVGLQVVEAHINKDTELTLCFDNQQSIFVPYGFYEVWYYRCGLLHLHGGNGWII